MKPVIILQLQGEIVQIEEIIPLVHGIVDHHRNRIRVLIILSSRLKLESVPHTTNNTETLQIALKPGRSDNRVTLEPRAAVPLLKHSPEHVSSRDQHLGALVQRHGGTRLAGGVEPGTQDVEELAGRVFVDAEAELEELGRVEGLGDAEAQIALVLVGGRVGVAEGPVTFSGVLESVEVD